MFTTRGYRVMDKVGIGIRLLLVLLVAGYVGVNFMANLPVFLIAENLLYAFLYAVSLYLIHLNKRYSYTLASIVAAFNAGRVSRSVITPTGELAPLALSHLPLLLVIALVMVLSALRAARVEG